MSEEQKSEFKQVGETVLLNSEAQKNNIASEQTKQLQYQMEEQEKSLADSQLDCEKVLFELYHSLKQDVLRPNEEKDGVLDWFPINDVKERVLTDKGIDAIMQIMKGYINKETLLSNFDEKTINRRMLEFSLSFSGFYLLKYEMVFKIQSLEECQEILKKRIEQKVNKRRMACEILNEEFDEIETKEKIITELKPRMEYELTKIKDESMKVNLREFEMIFTMLKHLVESTHNRAWKGEERGSLRRHMNISEVMGSSNQPLQQKKKWGIF